MGFIKRARFWVMAAVVVVAFLILQQFWKWEIERVDVPAGSFLVRIHKWGKNLPSDQIVASREKFGEDYENYQGVMEPVIPEGRHFLNPIFWSYKVVPLMDVPPGKFLVRTRLFGTPIPKDRLERQEIFAQDGESGILEEILLPGHYRINPFAYKYELIDEVNIRPDQVGVRTLKVGKDPSELAKQNEPLYVVPEGYRGVQQDPVRPGIHRPNPYKESIIPIRVSNHIVDLADLEFPSKDGFILKPHIKVEYAVSPEKAPEMFVRLSDNSMLHQEDLTAKEQQENEILQKVILPFLRGHARIEGSNLDAKEFILATAVPVQPGQEKPPAGQEKAANVRQHFQRTILAKVKLKCAEHGIDIRAITLASMPPPEELAKQISMRDLALAEQEKNKATIKQHKSEQLLKAAEGLKKQAQEKVEAETRLLQAETSATQKKEVEQLKLKNELANATLNLEASKERAKAVLAEGKAEADKINLENQAEVAGLKKAIQGFPNVSQFAHYQMLAKLGPALSEIFTTDDSEFAKIFANFMTTPPAGSMKPPAAANGAAPKPTTP